MKAKSNATMDKPMATLTHADLHSSWMRKDLRDALRKSGFAWKADGEEIEAGLLAQGCEIFLDKETDGDVIALYEFAETIRGTHGADARLVAAHA